MSQLIVHPATIVDSIPMTRRITEIMQEKGKYYSVTAMAARIGIHRETYRNMLKGEREIYTFELKKIAEDLKITVERLTQHDIQTISDELKILLNSRRDPERMLSLALQLESIALGCTEKCIAMDYLGYAYFEKKHFEQANVVLSKAYELAESIYEKYDETDLKYRIMRHLMQNFIELKDFSRALEISEQVELTFEKNPLRIGELLYMRAMVKESQGDLIGACELCYKSLEYCIKADNQENIGRAYVNIAHMEYFLGNFQNSNKMLEKALECFRDNQWSKTIVEKELVKTLTKLGHDDRAIDLIYSCLENAKKLRLRTIEGKLHILLSRVTGEPKYAYGVLTSDEFEETIRYLACKYLIGHYRKTGDAFNFLHYYEVAEKMKQTIVSDILDEKEL